ncbi:YidB family protein [Streptomyces sp. NPDC059524]|uniref:YidB family protein n=1 Tax=Streptomyces sp. NPDC059524 TaxID=3346856 RepID=UPI0036C7FCDE
MAGMDLGGLLGGLLGGGGGSAAGGGGGAGANVLGSLLQSVLAGRAGGGAAGSDPLGGLMDMITKSGLGDQRQLDSWIGTGDNQPLTPEQVKQAVPDDTLDKVAAEAGVSRDEAAQQVARQLPQVVDRLTPDGQVPSGASLEDLVREQRL